MGSSSKGFSYDELPRLDPNPIEKSRYQMYGDPKPDGTYQIQKTLWDGTNIQVSQRVGDEERLWVRDKLTRLHVTGFLTPAEYQARDSAAEVAVTRESLNKLISDLPAHEDDWKGVRKIPLGTYPIASRQDMDRAVAIVAKRERRLQDSFPLFMVLGMLGFLAGVIGLDAHTTTDLTIYAAMLTFMSLVSILAGSILAKMT